MLIVILVSEYYLTSDSHETRKLDESRAIVSSLRRQFLFWPCLPRNGMMADIFFATCVSSSHTSPSTFDNISSEERSAGSNSASEDEEPANDGFFTPERVCRFDDGDKILENSETESLLPIPLGGVHP